MTIPVKKPRKKPFAANAKTLEFLRAAGWTVVVVERNLAIPGKFCKQDLFGFLDIVGVRADGRGVLGVQATSGGGSKGQSNGLMRMRKVLANPVAKVFVQAGNPLWLIVWKKDHRGYWMPEITVLDIDHFKEPE